MQPQQTYQPIQPSQSTVGAIHNLETKNNEKHTRFLNSVGGANKAFRIVCTVIKPDDGIVELEKKLTQANQRSDMNVISMSLTKRLDLARRSLEKMNFKGLSMRTTDYRETVLLH